MSLRFMAGAMGVPFLPTRSGMGTDLINQWGFSKALRRREAKLPEKKLAVLENPFEPWGDTTRVVVVPAITPDVTIVHVQQADAQGNLRIQGLPFTDVEQIKAARCVIATCEELVDTDALRQAPDQNQIPFFCVDAVVPMPFGAYPTACFRYYDYDPVFLNEYRRTAQNDALHQAYVAYEIKGVADHQEFLNRIGEKRLKAIMADPRTGYASGLDRR
jgi:glutaconate CoA-transferase subunit A